MHVSLPVEEFTTPDPITATEGMLVDDLWRLMSQNGIRHVPIVRDDQVVGIVSDRDVRAIIGLTAAEKMQVTAADIMSDDLVTVSSSTPLDEVAFLMADKKVGSVIVTDENRELYGIFTATDALNALVELVRKGGAKP